MLGTEATPGVLCGAEGAGLVPSGEEVAQRSPWHSASTQNEGVASGGWSFLTDNK